MQREGLFREMRLRKHYEKPSEKRVREKTEAIRRARKLARKKLQREGLLPITPRVVRGTVGRGAPARTLLGLDSRTRTRPGSVSAVETHGKHDQGDAAKGRCAGGGSPDPGARPFRCGRQGAGPHCQEARICRPRPD